MPRHTDQRGVVATRHPFQDVIYALGISRRRRLRVDVRNEENLHPACDETLIEVFSCLKPALARETCQTGRWQTVISRRLVPAP